MKLAGVSTVTRRTPPKTPKLFFTKVDRIQSLTIIMRINLPNIQRSVSKSDNSSKQFQLSQSQSTSIKQSEQSIINSNLPKIYKVLQHLVRNRMKFFSFDQNQVQISSFIHHIWTKIHFLYKQYSENKWPNHANYLIYIRFKFLLMQKIYLPNIVDVGTPIKNTYLKIPMLCQNTCQVPTLKYTNNYKHLLLCFE